MAKVKPLPEGPKWSVANIPTEMNWEAARIFLQVSRCGSFRGASQKLGQSVNAVRRSVEKFEKGLGVQLLARHVGGIRLTPEGKGIAEAAGRMEVAAFGLLQARDLSSAETEGEVTVSATEGMGTYWLLPHLTRLQQTNPGLELKLHIGQKPADLLRLEADLSIQLHRPTGPDLKMLKLGRLHMIFWGSISYISARGCPTSLKDLRSHRFVVLSSEGRIQWERAYHKLVGAAPSPKSIALRTNSANTHFWAVCGGEGIGSLPTYIKALDCNLVPLDVTEPHPLDIWLVYRAGAKDIPRIRKVIDCIMACYDSRAMPWFRDEFVHPDRFAELYKGPPLPGMMTVKPPGVPGHCPFPEGHRPTRRFLARY